MKMLATLVAIFVSAFVIYSSRSFANANGGRVEAYPHIHSPDSQAALETLAKGFEECLLKFENSNADTAVCELRDWRNEEIQDLPIVDELFLTSGLSLKNVSIRGKHYKGAYFGIITIRSGNTSLDNTRSQQASHAVQNLIRSL